MSLAMRQGVHDRCGVCVHSLLVSYTSHCSPIAMYTHHIAQVVPSGPSRVAAKSTPAMFNRPLVVTYSHMCCFYVHME